MKIAIIIVGAVLAAIGIAWAWYDRAALGRDLTRVAQRVHEGLTQEVNSVRGRVIWLESQAKSVAERLWDEDDKDEIEALKHNLFELEQGAVSLAHKEATRAHGRITSLEKRLSDLSDHVHVGGKE